MKFIGFLFQLWTLVFVLFIWSRVGDIEDGSFVRQQSIREEWANRQNHELTREQIYKLQDQIQGLRLEIRELLIQSQ